MHYTRIYTKWYTVLAYDNVRCACEQCLSPPMESPPMERYMRCGSHPYYYAHICMHAVLVSPIIDLACMVIYIRYNSDLASYLMMSVKL